MHGTLKTLTVQCAECASAFAPKRADAAEFCGKECRQHFNNRRMQRGAILFDMYVHTRFNRKVAGEKGLQTLIDRMIGNWVEEDRRANDGKGRKTMRDLFDVMETAMPHTNVRYDIRAGR